LPITRHGDDLILAVRLTPKARRPGIGGIWTGPDGKTFLSASVTAPPDKGAANNALIILIAQALSVPASKVTLEAGATSRLKRVRIIGCPDAEAIIAVLVALKD
jgi:uncharacterized protein